MEWVDIHKLDTIEPLSLSIRQNKWFDIAKTLDRTTIILALAGFNVDKIKVYMGLQKTSQLAELLDLTFDEPTDDITNSIVLAKQMNEIDFDNLSLAAMSRFADSL